MRTEIWKKSVVAEETSAVSHFIHVHESRIRRHIQESHEKILYFNIYAGIDVSMDLLSYSITSGIPVALTIVKC